MIDYGPLARLLADPAVSEVMVNGPADIWVERAGALTRTTASFADEAALLDMILGIAAYVGRRVSGDEPMLDARLPDGSRVNVILPPLSLVGPVVTIRRFGAERLTGEDMVRLRSLSPAALLFLQGCVLARRNILVSGATGAGKTTLLNALSTFIPRTERIISIEDSAELLLDQPHWVRLETRPPDLDGRHGATQRDLVRNALRMRPDRIVVGEVRGGEALDMLQAMSTGHDGSLSTIHANNARDALARLEMLVLMAGIDLPHRAIREFIASTINIIVHLERNETGQRAIVHIAEIVGREGEVVSTQDVFALQEQSSRTGSTLALAPTMVRPRAVEQMARVRHMLPPALLEMYPDLRYADPGRPLSRSAGRAS